MSTPLRDFLTLLRAMPAGTMLSAGPTAYKLERIADVHEPLATDCEAVAEGSGYWHAKSSTTGHDA